MKNISVPVAIGVFLACVMVGFFAYANIISRDYEDWRMVKTELTFNCMLAPSHTLMICNRYADWVLEQTAAHLLRNCYESYEKRQRQTYPSIAVCTAIYKVSFNMWSQVDPNYCISGKVC